MKYLSQRMQGLVSRTFAALLLLFSTPIWIYRLASAYLAGGSAAFVSCAGPSGSFRVLRLVSRSGGQQHLWLPCVALGDMRFVGPEPRFEPATFVSGVPGLVSPSRLRQRVGMGHQVSRREDQAFFNSATAGQRLALLLRYCFTALLGLTPTGCDAHTARIEVFGVRIDSLSMRGAVERITEYCQRPQGSLTKIAAFVNPDCLNKAHADRQYHYLLGRFDLVLPDGSGLRLATKLLGSRLQDNVNGTDLFPLLCERAASAGLRLFLFGGRQGVAQAAAKTMQKRYPALQVASCLDGYSHSDDSVVREINASRADIVLVGLGAPSQEKWLSRHRGGLRCAVGIGVGGLFDYYSGRVRRAPLWLREAGLEWIWRILEEPGAKWRRYVLGNPLFLLRVLSERWIRSYNQLEVLPSDQLPTARAFAGELEAGIVSAGHNTSLSKRTWRTSLAVRSLTKRFLDVSVSSMALLVLSPLLLATSMAIRIESKGPIFFRQTRVGARGKLFTMYKFRSMFIDAEQRLESLHEQNESADGVLFKMKRDPRITRVGQLIRRLSIDELPQVFNVLQGEMSIVGPRPALPNEVARYTTANRKRLQAKPGLTCLWQIGGRSDLSFSEQVELDVNYLRKQNLITDLAIIAKTVPAVLSGKGAY